MHEIWKKLEQFQIAHKFAQLGGVWSPETGKELQSFLATQGIQASMEQIHDFLQAQPALVSEALPVAGAEIADLEESRVEEARLAEEIEEIEELDEIVEEATIAEGKSKQQLAVPPVVSISDTDSAQGQDSAPVQAIEELPSAIFNIGESVPFTSSPAMSAVPLSEEEAQDIGSAPQSGDDMSTVMGKPGGEVARMAESLAVADEQAASERPVPTESMPSRQAPALLATTSGDKVRSWQEVNTAEPTDSTGSPAPELIAMLEGDGAATQQAAKPAHEAPEFFATSSGDKDQPWEEEAVAAEAVEDLSKELAAVDGLPYGSSAAMQALPVSEDEENLLAQGIVIESGSETSTAAPPAEQSEPAKIAEHVQPSAPSESPDDQVLISSEILAEEKQNEQVEEELIADSGVEDQPLDAAGEIVAVEPLPALDQAQVVEQELPSAGSEAPGGLAGDTNESDVQGIVVEADSPARMPAMAEATDEGDDKLGDDIFEEVASSAPAKLPAQPQELWEELVPAQGEDALAEPLANADEMPEAAAAAQEEMNGIVVAPDESARALPPEMRASFESAFTPQQEAERQQKIIDMENRAEEYWQGKHYPEAITLWNELLVFEDIPEIHEKISAAEVQMQQASQLWSNAQFLAECDKEKDALQVLKQCLLLYPYHEGARQLLVRLESQMSSKEGQLMELFVLGQKSLQDKQFKKAQQIWKQAEDLLPENSSELADWVQKTSNMILESVLAEGRQYLKRKDLQRAYEIWALGKELLPEAVEIEQELKKTDIALQDAKKLFNKSKDLFALFELAKAQEALFSCLKLCPDYPQASELEVQISEALGKEAEYLKLIAQSDNLVRDNKLSEAVDILQQAMSTIPKNNVARERLQRVQEQLAARERQRTSYFHLWEQAEQAEKQGQYERALHILAQIHTKTWDFADYDRELEEQFWGRLQQIQIASQKVSEQIKSTAAHLQQKRIKDTQRMLASEIFKQPVTETVQKELADIHEQVRQMGQSRAAQRKLAAACLLLGILCWQGLAWALIPKEWMTRSLQRPSEPEWVSLKKEATAAMQEKKWPLAKGLYVQLKSQAPADEQAEIEAALNTIAREEYFLSLLGTARGLAREKNWQELRKTLQDLKTEKPDYPELQSLEQSIPRLAPETQLRIAMEIKELTAYRETVRQELGKLEAAVQELAPLSKYGKTPSEVAVVLQSSQKRLDTISQLMEQSKQALEKSDESLVPQAALRKWKESALLVQIKAAQDKVAAVNKEAKRVAALETTCRKGIAYLQKRAGEFQSQREKLADSIDKMQQYPANRGFKQLPAAATSLLAKLKREEEEIKKLLTEFNLVVENANYVHYPAYIQKAKETQNLASVSEAGKLMPDIDAVLSTNAKLAQNPTFLEKEGREAWQKSNPDIGNKILGAWYAQLDRSLQEYQTVSKRAPQYMKTQGARKVYLLLNTQLAILQRYPQEISKLEWKIYRLEQGGMNLEESLKQRRETVVMPLQIKQINALRRYLSTRKFDVDMSSWLTEIDTAVTKLVQEVADKNVDEATIRDIYRATQRIDEKFQETFRSLDGELSNLSARKE